MLRCGDARVDREDGEVICGALLLDGANVVPDERGDRLGAERYTGRDE